MQGNPGGCLQLQRELREGYWAKSSHADAGTLLGTHRHSGHKTPPGQRPTTASLSFVCRAVGRSCCSVLGPRTALHQVTAAHISTETSLCQNEISAEVLLEYSTLQWNHSESSWATPCPEAVAQHTQEQLRFRQQSRGTRPLARIYLQHPRKQAASSRPGLASSGWAVHPPCSAPCCPHSAAFTLSLLCRKQPSPCGVRGPAECLSSA